MSNRTTDEDIAEWRTWAPGVLLNEGADIDPILDALEDERARADGAQARLVQVLRVIDRLEQGCVSCSSSTGGDHIADMLRKAIA